jgi:hypothetical protein
MPHLPIDVTGPTGTADSRAVIGAAVIVAFAAQHP